MEIYLNSLEQQVDMEVEAQLDSMNSERQFYAGLQYSMANKPPSPPPLTRSPSGYWSPRPSPSPYERMMMQTSRRASPVNLSTQAATMMEKVPPRVREAEASFTDSKGRYYRVDHITDDGVIVAHCTSTSAKGIPYLHETLDLTNQRRVLVVGSFFERHRTTGEVYLRIL